MLSAFGFNNYWQPTEMLYEHDTNLKLVQSEFKTQQGLALNLVNILSACRDTTIVNYSNIFLSSRLPINDVIYLSKKNDENLSFPTYLALSAYPVIGSSTRYVSISSNPGQSSPITTVASLSNSEETYFAFVDIDGLKCRVSLFDDDRTKNLTVNLTSFDCYFAEETPLIEQQRSNIFEYALDSHGFLKLFFRNGSNFYIIRNSGSNIVAVDASINSPQTTDIFATTYRAQEALKFKNNFVYYDKGLLKRFIINDDLTISDIAQNHVVSYSYDSDVNFVSAAEVLVDFFKPKNVISNDGWVNDTLPSANPVIQRDYSSIISKFNGETFNGAFQIGYNYYTKEFLFIPDVTTKFTLGDNLYPYSVLNIADCSLINCGSFGGLTPMFSDKIVKQQNNNTNASSYNESNGMYLYSWLYTDTINLTSYWVDRYYNPKRTTINAAYSGTNNQIFTYTSDLSAFLSAYYPADDYLWYDIKSSLTFEPSASYFYSRIGPDYIKQVVSTFPISAVVNQYDGENAFQRSSNDINFDGNTYGEFKLASPSYTLSFNVLQKHADSLNATLLVGNNYDEGLSIYKGGNSNIFTPGVLINTLSGVELFNPGFTYALNVSSIVKSPVKVLDIVHNGLDHPIKLFYSRTDNEVPGFAEFNINGELINAFEFASLSSVFVKGENIKLFSKEYINTDEIWYYASNNVYKFNYHNNTYIGSLSVGPNNWYANSVVTYNGAISTLSGFRGLVLDDTGISKIENALYYKDFATNTEAAALTTFGASIFDITTLDNELYVQMNGEVSVFDIYKRKINSYTLSPDVVSGCKIDFVNVDYKTRLVSYGFTLSGHIFVDEFDLDSSTPARSYNTGIKANKQFFGEFNVPKRGKYTKLSGIGVVTNQFISGYYESEYNWANPIMNGLTAIPINAIVAGTSDNCGVGSTVIGTMSLTDNSPIPEDMSINLYRADTGTLLGYASANNTATELYVSYPNPIVNVPYSVECVRSSKDIAAIKLSLKMSNGSFYNGSFRSAVIGSQYIGLYSPGYACALLAEDPVDLLPENNFIYLADAYALSPFFTVLPYKQYNPNTSFNNYTQNPLNNFFASGTAPHLVLVANPGTTNSTNTSYTTGFSATLLEFASNFNPPYGPSALSATPLSGAPFQVPTNFNVVKNINHFDEDYVARLDLYAGNNYKNKQTLVTPFTGGDHIAVSLDPVNGTLKIYRDGMLSKTASFSATLFTSSYFTDNSYGVGKPLINNVASDSDNALDFALNSICAYNRVLNDSEVMFDYLKDRKIDAVNFDIPAGTRNNVDTVKSFNKFSIPGRKNNTVKVYIQNLNVTDESKPQITSQILEKLRNVLPITTDQIEIVYNE